MVAVKNGINSGHWDCIMDRAYMMDSIIDRELLEERCVQSLKDDDPVKVKLLQACELLGEVYQLAGQKASDLHEKEQSKKQKQSARNAS